HRHRDSEEHSAGIKSPARLNPSLRAAPISVAHFLFSWGVLLAREAESREVASAMTSRNNNPFDVICKLKSVKLCTSNPSTATEQPTVRLRSKLRAPAMARHCLRAAMINSTKNHRPIAPP